MYTHILHILMQKYGHLSYSELLPALRRDGFGDFVELIENHDIINLLVEKMKKNTSGLSEYYDMGIIPSSVQEIKGTSVEYDENIKFNHKACLEKCTGTCCKTKNYLMINFPDIFSILSSPAAPLLKIRSTRDLFERKPPFVVLFYMETYKISLPFIRYVPINADLNVRPEDAEGSICPFLYPIEEVYSYYKKQLPKWANKEAMGCILMEHKPIVCRLSPLGQQTGMVTGKVTYQYLAPALDCPACKTDVEVKVADFISNIISSSEKQKEKDFHKMLMRHHARDSMQQDPARLIEILEQIYNIDALLAQYGLGLERRPSMEHLMEIAVAAANGDFSLYEHFIDDLRS